MTGTSLIVETLLSDPDFMAITCQDCPRIRFGQECPVCDDPFDPQCWNHRAVKDFVSNILSACEDFGFEVDKEDYNV